MQKFSCIRLASSTRRAADVSANFRLLVRLAARGASFSAIAATAALLSGCVLEPTKIDRTPPPDSSIIMRPAVLSATDALQSFLLQAKKMSPAELVLEKEKTRAEFNTEKSELNRMKLALLLILPTPATTTAAALIADDAELAALVDPVASGASANAVGAATVTGNPETRLAESEARVLALLIQGSMQERKRLRDQSRDWQLRTQVAKTDLTKSEQEARILRTKMEELETQLAALKSIERSVTSRTKGRAAPILKDGAPK